ncbi:DUF2846 domain-containing protein [Segetibacter sp. 3557_3]|uniref:DUF2846 domain-containing protein n=1 Tax=Segetibacter sp. 3557_3 TaxID=2547429 RepID=UPI001058DB83|nr:DUF2846 domain-containing protein [Segetibacter sp. 3557_3]TDH28694.1 DUF2846 domain-containing protein [Segetibacter sp. 3557_3]
MKNLIFAAIFTIAATSLSAQADSTTIDTSRSVQTNTVDSASMSKIYVIRSTGHVGSAINLRVLVDDMMFCKVHNNRYAEFFVQPGTHLFNATSWDKPGSREKFALKVPVEAGKTYYMTMKIKQRFASTEITLEEITYNTAAPLIAKYKHDECD